jgi:beta-glucosidase
MKAVPKPQFCVCSLSVLAMTIVAVVGLSTSATAQQAAPYLNSKLPVDQRVSDLLGRMTLEEKVAQLESTWQNRGNTPKNLRFTDEQGNFLPDRASALLKNGLGEMSRPSETMRPNGRGPREMAEFTNTLQKWIKENTRLGIPVLFHEECLHGHVAPGATSFPQAIALASTWDPELVHTAFTTVALETRAAGAQQCLAPVLDLARDPRWGRTEETYGEDPYLVTRIGVAAITGYQGKDPAIDREHVIATAKHFAVHGQPEAGTNVAPGNYSERVVREYFLKPFEAAVKEANVQSVMPSYNEIDGIPSHSNNHLLNDVLRGEWGFKGMVVSDYFAINEMITVHHIAANLDDAAKMALEAGVDVELPFVAAYSGLVQQVKQGKIPETTVNRAVGRILREKFLTGLFDDPYVDPTNAEKVTNTPEHQQLSLKAAHEAIILLKNENHILPFSKTQFKKIAVIGPNAADVHLGGYSDKPGRGVSVLQGIKDKLGSSAEVVYSVGCKITESDAVWSADKVVLGDPAQNATRIQEAVELAKSADAVILVLGENEQTSREAWAKTHEGDRDSLDLLGNQDDLAKAIMALGKPTVALLLNGRPNSINYLAQNMPAILEGWYLGQEGGTAAADVLFGDYNPGGKLPITIPRNVGQLPDYYYFKPSAKREYLGTTTEPLYPFGWGLSYSSFTYGNLRLAPGSISPSGQTKVSVDVTNSGQVRGDEVVQLYIRDDVSSVTRPVKELRGFKRITLDPGQTKTVDFPLGFDELSFLDRKMQRVVEPGTFTIMVGGNSAATLQNKLNVTAQ